MEMLLSSVLFENSRVAIYFGWGKEMSLLGTVVQTLMFASWFHFNSDYVQFADSSYFCHIAVFRRC